MNSDSESLDSTSTSETPVFIPMEDNMKEENEIIINDKKSINRPRILYKI